MKLVLYFVPVDICLFVLALYVHYRMICMTHKPDYISHSFSNQTGGTKRKWKSERDGCITLTPVWNDRGCEPEQKKKKKKGNRANA